jgi:hypothetical protein
MGGIMPLSSLLDKKAIHGLCGVAWPGTTATREVKIRPNRAIIKRASFIIGSILG